MSIDNAVQLLFGAGLLLLLIVVVASMNRMQKSASPAVQAIIVALRPYIQDGIRFADRMALEAVQAGEKQLDGLNKHNIAVAVYDALPDHLMIGSVPVPIGIIKQLVPRETFASLVETEYLAGKAKLVIYKGYFQTQVNALSASAQGTGAG